MDGNDEDRRRAEEQRRWEQRNPRLGYWTRRLPEHPAIHPVIRQLQGSSQAQQPWPTWPPSQPQQPPQPQEHLPAQVQRPPHLPPPASAQPQHQQQRAPSTISTPQPATQGNSANDIPSRIEFTIPRRDVTAASPEFRVSLHLSPDTEFEDFYSRASAYMDVPRNESVLGFKFSDARRSDPPRCINDEQAYRDMMAEAVGKYRRSRSKKDICIDLYDLVPTPAAVSRAEGLEGH
ncbi:hypothetical protein GGG16DRAFT_106969 [Schizophyllum commune]